MEYLRAFVVGGLICVVGQLLIDLTRLTPARIMVLYVTGGVVLGALGWYTPLINYAGCGATVPLCGFGSLLAEGVRTAVAEKGLLGAFTGGVTAGAAGIAAAVFFGYLAALFARPGTNREKQRGSAGRRPQNPFFSAAARHGALWAGRRVSPCRRLKTERPSGRKTGRPCLLCA